MTPSYFVRFIYGGSNGYRFGLSDLDEAIRAAHEILAEKQHVGAGCRAAVIMQHRPSGDDGLTEDVEVYSTLRLWRNINEHQWNFWMGILPPNYEWSVIHPREFEVL